MPRLWRKVTNEITDSNKLAEVSDGAFTLYVLLLLEQDDRGNVRWSPVEMNRATACRTHWDFDQANAFMDELSQAYGQDTRPLVERHHGYVYIVKGEEKNGRPDARKPALIYNLPKQDGGAAVAGPSPATAQAVAEGCPDAAQPVAEVRPASGQPVASQGESREEKRRGEKTRERRGESERGEADDSPAAGAAANAEKDSITALRQEALNSDTPEALLEVAKRMGFKEAANRKFAGDRRYSDSQTTDQVHAFLGFWNNRGWKDGGQTMKDINGRWRTWIIQDTTRHGPPNERGPGRRGQPAAAAFRDYRT